MKFNHPLCLFLALLPFFVSANIWDNLFLGQGIAFRIPEDFQMVLSKKEGSTKVEFTILGSASLNSLSINIGGDFSLVPKFLTSSVIAARANLTAGTMSIHSALKDCIPVEDERLNITGFYHLIEGYVELITLLLSRKEENNFYTLRANDLLEIVEVPSQWLAELNITKDDFPELVLYFDMKTQQLKKIGVTLPDKRHYDLDVVKLERYKVKPADFVAPEDWKCGEEDGKRFEEIDPQELLNDMKDSKLYSIIQKFLPEDVALPDFSMLEKYLGLLDRFRK